MAASVFELWPQPGQVIVDKIETPELWETWRDWMYGALGKRYFPERMVVFGLLPPTTAEGASILAGKINAIRDELKWSKRVPQQPKPWAGAMTVGMASEAKRLRVGT